MGNIAGKELDNTIKQMKRNKAPGPDRVISGLYKWLGMDARGILREILNECWEDEEVPKVLLEAHDASVYKTWDTQHFANYRPISLLNGAYKILAAIIQTIISSKIDQVIQKTQYGFRANRSTSQALYVARRLQYLAEQSGQGMIMCFLDWENAFDKVDQTRMLEALERLNIQEKK